MLRAMEQVTTRQQTLPQAAVQARAGLPSASYLTLVTSYRAFDQLRDQWLDLEERCGKPPTVFQSFAWCRTWSDVYAKPDSTKELFIIAGYQHNKLVFIWPLLKQMQHGQRVLSWLTQPIGQYGDILADQAIDASRWLTAATRFLRQTKVADCMHLRHVRENANCGAHAKAHWHDGKLYERAPAMDLAPFKSEEEYDARYDASQRRRRKKIRKRLEEIGPVKFESLAPEQADEAIDLATSEKLLWLRQRGRFNEVLNCPNHAILLKNLMRLSHSNVQTTTLRLSAGGKPVSWEVGFRYRNTHYGYLTSHMNALTDVAPGRLTLDLSQRLALKDGFGTFDLMVPYDQHKESFASVMVPVNDYFLPLTFKGALYGHGYLGTLRPILRRIYQRLPLPALRVIKRLLRQ